jgi:signal transduction histidine kinase
MRKSHSEERRPDGKRGDDRTVPSSAILPLPPTAKATVPSPAPGGISPLSPPNGLRGDAAALPEPTSSGPRRRGGRAPASVVHGNDAAGLAHDARNLLSALSVYCELLASPGVLAPGFRHFAEDLRLVGETGARLVEALARPAEARSNAPLPIRRRPFPGIEDLASEVLSFEATLRALAGPAVQVEVECAPCAGLLALNSEDLLRILFNLIANSVEAMLMRPAAPNRQPSLRITAQRGGGASFLGGCGRQNLGTVALLVRDNGPGIAATDLERIFDPGFSTRRSGPDRDYAMDRARAHRGTADFEAASDRLRTRSGGVVDEAPRGLGLAIVRQLVEAAGGSVCAVASPGCGVRFDIELPILTPRMPTSQSGRAGQRSAIQARATLGT